MVERVFGTRIALRFVLKSLSLSQGRNRILTFFFLVQARTVEYNAPTDSQAFMATWKGNSIDGMSRPLCQLVS